MILDGRAIARDIRRELKSEVGALSVLLGRSPRLVVVLVGEDPASQVYVANKERGARRVGIESQTLRFPAHVGVQQLLDEVDRLGADPAVDGILVQLPLPSHIAKDRVLARIPPDKDVDGIHVGNLGAVAAGRPGLAPCTAVGVMELLRRAEAQLWGAEALVIGASSLAGMPIAMMLVHAGATVTVAHRPTRDLEAHVRRAEILVSATGVPHLVKGAWIRDGAVVIDVGITRAHGTLIGDVEYEEAAARARAITPVPGGVGPMTIAMLLKNTVEAARARAALGTVRPSADASGAAPRPA